MCEHLENGTCVLSSALAKIPVPIEDKACETCKESDKPMTLNGVVCSRAIWALRQRQLPVDPQLFDCIADSQREGPGNELKELLSKWSDPEKSCDCNARIAQMNSWGVVGCLRNFTRIVNWIHSEAIKRYPILKFLPTKWYFKRLVKKAIINARRKNVRPQLENKTRQEEGLSREAPST